MRITTIGLDIAKNVFQVHGIRRVAGLYHSTDLSRYDAVYEA